MNHTRSLLFAMLILLLASFSTPSPAMAQGTSDLTIEVSVICEQIEEREPVNVDSTFAVTVEKLYCFTKIAGAEEQTTISHVWYWGETERARIELPVRSISWRTYTAKKIQEHEVGNWRVDVLNADGTVLRTIRFNITP